MKFTDWLYKDEKDIENLEARTDFMEEYQTALHESYHNNMAGVLRAMELQTNSIKGLMEEVSELRTRLKSLENEVLLIDEDYQEFQRGNKTNILNIAMRTKLKPKDLVSFPKGFDKYNEEVEDLAEKTLTNLA